MRFLNILSHWFGGRIRTGVSHPLYPYKKDSERRSGRYSIPSPAHSSMFHLPGKHSKGGGPPEKTPTEAPPPSYDASLSAGSSASQHNWQTAVPDTSLLPPPPSFSFDASPTNNATEDEANRADAWCARHPLRQPTPLNPAMLQRLDNGQLQILKPHEFKGTITELRPGIFQCVSNSRNTDSCLTSDLPLYVVDAHSPFFTESKTKTIYFEIKVFGNRDEAINIALGFVAPPYPVFRLPGWHRGSLGVHGDDGHRYVNNIAGGKEFTNPFKAGETLGLGMTFTLTRKAAGFVPGTYAELVKASSGANQLVDVSVFFTRNGREEGRWDVHEERDGEDDLPVTGLEGVHDLFAAVGTFEGVAFEVRFRRGDWLFQPPL